STLLSPPLGLDVRQAVFIVVYVRYTPGSRQWVHRQLAVASLRHHSVSNGATRIHKPSTPLSITLRSQENKVVLTAAFTSIVKFDFNSQWCVRASLISVESLHPWGP